MIFENSYQSVGKGKYLGKKMCKEGGFGEEREGSFASLLAGRKQERESKGANN